MKKKIITIIVVLLMLLTFTTMATGKSVEDNSDIIDININNAPDAPVILKEKCGWNGEIYQLTFSSVDPDGDAVYYHIDWGKKESGENLFTCEPDDPQEAWRGPYKSGDEVTCKHEWSEKGRYTITIKAKDKYDFVSPETTMTVSKPKIKVLHNSIFLLLFEQLANIFPILREIIKL